MLFSFASSSDPGQLITRVAQVSRLVAFATVVVLGGCMSLGGTFLEEDECNKVYIGTRLDMICVTSGGHNVASAPFCLLLDLPFSLVADTVLLPFTIPVSIRSCNKDEAVKRTACLDARDAARSRGEIS